MVNNINILDKLRKLVHLLKYYALISMCGERCVSEICEWQPKKPTVSFLMLFMTCELTFNTIFNTNYPKQKKILSTTGYRNVINMYLTGSVGRLKERLSRRRSIRESWRSALRTRPPR